MSESARRQFIETSRRYLCEFGSHMGCAAPDRPTAIKSSTDDARHAAAHQRERK